MSKVTQNIRDRWQSAPLSPDGCRPSPFHVSAAEAARLLREQLKARFPGVKFQVITSDRTCLNVRWVDGPRGSEVSGLAEQYRGGGFDGSIDLAYHVTHWLHPDGTTTVASSPGTVDSGGYISKITSDCPAPGCLLVSFGSRYIFVYREMSAEAERQLRVKAAAYYGYADDLSRNIHQYHPCGDHRSVAWFVQQFEQRAAESAVS